MKMSSIEVKNAQKSYGKGENKNLILNGLKMRVEAGKIYSLIGASGCGKTTLLQCILGMKSLDCGSISVLGRVVKSTKVNKFSHLMGYMPQQTSLVPELTIKETLYYFGNIFQMNQEDLKMRFKMLQELLELPEGGRKVEKLSGGQKRRVSLAAALIHNPLVLILDEPTVGLESLLREKIWKFLIDTTSSTCLSVVITTHYISEASKADCVGLMRDGRLLAEDSPTNINLRFETETLDEAFLKLCLLDTCGNEIISTQLDETIVTELQPAVVVENQVLKKRKKFSKQTFAALLKKEYIRVKRQPSEIMFMLIFPIIQVLLFGYCIGRLPTGLKLGIVNDEVDFSHCSSFLKNQTNGKASCDLLYEITDDIATKIFYNSYADAYRDAKHGIVTGFLQIPHNFTDIMVRSKSEEGDDDDDFKHGIDVHMDQTDLQITTFLQYRLLKAYGIFNKKFLRRFELNEKLDDSPMKFEKPIFGSFMSDFRNSMAPATILQIAYFSSIAFTSFSIAQNRLEGFWNRTLLAGVTSLEILIVQILASFVVVLVSVTETVLLAFFVIDLTIIGNGLTLIIILLLACAAGSFAGILLSCATDDIKQISMITLACGQVLSNLSGAVWPLEGQQYILRYFSFLMPITLPSISIRDVMLRGYAIGEKSVVTGISVLMAWMVGCLVLSFVVMRNKKFSESSL